MAPMSDWALATNLHTWAQAGQGFFGWPSSGAEAELVRSMSAGDLIVPKFAQDPTYGDAEAAEATKLYCQAIGANFDSELTAYNSIVAGGSGAVPFLLRVTGSETDDTRQSGEPWARVRVTKIPLAFPLSTQDFLRLRAIPPTISAQFKGTVSQGRHIQALPDGTGHQVLDAGRTATREDRLRRYTLVRALAADDAAQKLSSSGRQPVAGDRAFLVANGSMPGVHDVGLNGELHAVGRAIPRSPSDLRELLAEAQSKARKSDAFSPTHARAACAEMQSLLEGAVDCLAVDDYGRWHDRYEVLFRKVTQAEDLAARANQSRTSEQVDEEEEEEEVDSPESTEIDEATSLAGLTVDAVRRHLPPNMAVPDQTLSEAVTALRAGKHLLLGGPPGTGKSTIAEALCTAVMGDSFEVSTATADWTTFDTIGGYLPVPDQGIRFSPGIVLRALRSGAWLIIDELNRADIDKSFGPLFTLLSGSAGASGARLRSALPYIDELGRPVTIEWAGSRDDTEKYVITPTWRIIGTLNVADKASLFQLSFAFLRRFAVVDIPLPPSDMYETYIASLFEEIHAPEREQIIRACLTLAFGPIQIGPAIVADIARFVAKGVAPGADGSPIFEDLLVAFLTAVRLMAVPQYEGAVPGDGAKLVTLLQGSWSDTTSEEWLSLREAFRAIELR